MSRRNNRINIDRSLERHLDDLIDEVNHCIDDQEDHREDAIADLELQPEPIYALAARVMEVLHLDDGYSINKAIEQAADMAVNTAIYVGLEKNRDLKNIPQSLEEDLEDDHDDVNEMNGGRRNGRDRGGRGRGRDRERGSRSGRDSRQEAARSRRDEDDRGGRGNRSGRNNRNEREESSGNSAEERARRRQQQNEPRQTRNQGEERRDQVVEQAQENLNVNKPHLITSQYVQQNPGPFCSENKDLPLAPVYWLGGQNPMVINNEITMERVGENVEWERHRTDLYLAIRNTVKPSANLRDDAVNRAINARDQFVSEKLEELKEKANVIEETKPTDYKQVLKSSEIAGQFFGEGTPMAKMQTCLGALNLKFLPSHPVIMKLEQYPTWVMNKALTEAVEELLLVSNLTSLVPAMIKVMNECTPEQWAYFHDKVTYLINVILKVELEARPYLTSVLTEWNDFANWLEKNDGGSMIIWFKNNFNHFIRHYFHVYKHGSKLVHPFVDGTDAKYASVSITQNMIYVPVESENFGAASATKLGRVLESCTPKLYQLLANNIDDTTDNVLVTSSDEQVSVYSRTSAVQNKIIFMGEVSW